MVGLASIPISTRIASKTRPAKAGGFFVAFRHAHPLSLLGCFMPGFARVFFGISIMAQTDKKAPDWIAIEGEFRAGVKSVNAIASDHGISEGAIRKRAKKEGWSRDPSGTKRQIVKSVMSGGTNDGTNIALRTIEEAAADDIADMQRGLRISRLCLVNLETAAQSSAEPREIKVIVEATSAAIESIRKIRGLDDPAAGNAPAPSLDDFYGEPPKP